MLQLRGAPLLIGFLDCVWDGNPNNKKYYNGNVLSLGYKHVTWSCKKQQYLGLFNRRIVLSHS